LRGIVRIDFCASPLSPMARRAAATQAVRADSDTIRPCQTASNLLADDAIAIRHQEDQQIEHQRFQRHRPVVQTEFPPDGIERVAVEQEAQPEPLTAKKRRPQDKTGVSSGKDGWMAKQRVPGAGIVWSSADGMVPGLEHSEGTLT
jgi:hypothetical protein